jgi:hypothetical protein
VTRPQQPRQATGPAEAVAGLLDLPDVAEAVDAARAACTRLRWHQALRRRIPEAAAESRVRGAAATALLEGAEVAGSTGSVGVVRDLVRGAQAWPERPDPVWRTLRSAVQVTSATEHVGTRDLAAPAQLLAHLHVAAAAPLLPEHLVGRPRQPGEECGEWVELGPPPSAQELAARLVGVADLLRTVPDGRVPTLLVASLVHAELVAMRPFVSGNGLVARALERVVLRVGGLDPTGVAVPEAGHAAKVGADYRGALTAYVSGGPDGVRLWLLHCAEAVSAAAAHGEAVADAVLAGRTS